MRTIMNIRTILAALAVMTASACHDNLPKTDHYFSDEMVSLSVSVPTIKTKVSEKNSPGRNPGYATAGLSRTRAPGELTTLTEHLVSQ